MLTEKSRYIPNIPIPSSNPSLKDYWGATTELVNTFLRGLMEHYRGPEEIKEAMEYVLFPGGKRLRPFLTILSADVIHELLKAKGEEMNRERMIAAALPFAAALELIHNYSLVHDDLPAMDNDDYRRGKPTAHRVYGEGKAVLLGDQLLTMAFEVMSNPVHLSLVSPTEALKAIHHTAKKAGSRYLIGGQWYDLEVSRDEDVSTSVQGFRKLWNINTMKTGGLIMLSIQIPAILVSAPFDITYYLTGYGFWLGQLFQATDDLLDEDGYVSLIGKDRTSELADTFHSNALKKLDRLAERYSHEPLALMRELADFIRYRKK